MSCKPKQSATPPFAQWQGVSDYQSTYRAQFIAAPGHEPVKPIRPQAQHPWTSQAKFDTHSTAQDAYREPMFCEARVSCKPDYKFLPTSWPVTIQTTNQAMFIPIYEGAKRQPFLPHRDRPQPERFTHRSTTQEAYLPFPDGYKPRKQIKPAEPVKEKTMFDHTSTSRASYPRHPTTRFVPAKKPVPAIDMGW